MEHDCDRWLPSAEIGRGTSGFRFRHKPLLHIDACNHDQVAAGAFMWVFGSLVFLVPVVAVIGRALSPVGKQFPDLAVDCARDVKRARGEEGLE